MNQSRISIVSVAVIVTAFGAGHFSAAAEAVPRNVVYNPRSESVALDGISARVFADKYRVVPIKPGSGFLRARIKGHDLYLPDSTDPRPMREAKTSAKAAVAFVVSADGIVRDLRVLESTDKRVADFLMKKIEERRFAPAVYRGAPVASLEHIKVNFGPMDERDYSRMYKDGMGIMGQRDR